MIFSFSASKQLLWASLTDAFCSTWNNLLKHCISAKRLLTKGYVQGALREELLIASFVERLETTTVGKSN